jgi:tetratricopeptide (TPR) repeat protein
MALLAIPKIGQFVDSINPWRFTYVSILSTARYAHFGEAIAGRQASRAGAAGVVPELAERMTVAATTTGYQEIPEGDRKKAQAFFDRGRAVAGTGNYEYGIEMFLHGLELDPDSVEAHKELRDIGLKRKASGKKALGMFEAMKLKRSGKDDKQNMLNAEKLLSYDPGNTDHMLSLAQAAFAAGFYDTVLWIGPILQKANTESPNGKPDFNKFIALKDIYKSMAQQDGLPNPLRSRLWKMASDSCFSAAQLRPEDMDLQSEMKNLAASQTMSAGKYEEGGSFRDSVKDMAGQKELLEKDSGILSEDIVSRQIAQARAQYEADPNEAGKVMRYVEALAKAERAETDQQAMQVLRDVYAKTKNFRFRHAEGRIKLNQLKREERGLRVSLQRSPSDESVKQQYRVFLQYRLEEELAEYRLWAEHYPTDVSYRFEIGKRLFALRKFDEAIPTLQQARNDPKFRFEAGTYLGQAFLQAGYIDEAIDTLKGQIDEYQLRGDDKSKDMFYWYGVANEQKGDTATAIKSYSQLAQWDFTYRDVQDRIKRLRSADANPTSAG